MTNKRTTDKQQVNDKYERINRAPSAVSRDTRTQRLTVEEYVPEANSCMLDQVDRQPCHSDRARDANIKVIAIVLISCDFLFLVKL